MSDNILKCPAFSDCSVPIDVVLRSREGKTFGAHTAFLARYSGAFPRPDMITSTDPLETVDLDERSEVIKLILQFTHPDERPPETQDVPGDVMLEFAEAVEKFIIFPAMEVCNLRLAAIALEPKHAMGVLQFGIRHDRPRLRDVAALHAVSLDDTIDTQRKHFQSLQAFAAWAQFVGVHAQIERIKTKIENITHYIEVHAATDPGLEEYHDAGLGMVEFLEGHEYMKKAFAEKLEKLELTASTKPFNYYYTQEMS